ncbi:MAG: ATP-binding protein [Lactimicrobium massiliense]
MYFHRSIEKTIEEVGRSFPCIVIYGSRQVGKSTTIDHLYGEKYQKVTLDDMDDRLLAQSNPRLFLETYQWPLIIDEIQKAPGLLDEIKKVIDEQRLKWMKEDAPRQLMYILTGSNRFELQQGISDSLAGRCGVIDMASFSSMEKQKLEENCFSPEISFWMKLQNSKKIPYHTRSEIFETIFQGGMPDVVSGAAERNAFFKSYVSTYIEKDVRKLINASNELQFRNFISIAALRTAQELHYDEIAGSVGIDVRTCKRWISILETSGIIFLLQPYMANVSNRIIKAPKIYFMDTGLCAWLCKWPNAEMLSNSAMNGAFFETYVVSEIVKNAYAFNLDPHDFLYYYRDTDMKEIDLLYVIRDQIYPIEIKAGILPVHAAKNFSVLDKYKMKIETGLIICNTDKIRPINEKVYQVPVYLLP